MAKLKVGTNDLCSYCKSNNLQYLIDEWDYYNNQKTPFDYTYGSKESVFWICRECGVSFPARINTRVYYRTKYCPECARKHGWKTRHSIEVLKDNLLASFPGIASEWDYELNNGTTPNNVSKGTHTEYYWKCPKGHPSYLARVYNRTYRGDGCPICSGRKILVGFNDLGTVNPNLADQWDYDRNNPKTPQEVFPREGNKYWWICPICDDSYLALVSNRAAGKGHDKCSKKGTSFPEQAIFYYVKQVFPDSISRDTSLGFELDVFIPSLNVAIEYDGVQYHKGQKQLEKDNKKDCLCKNYGIKLLRFRDSILPDTISAIRITCPDSRPSVGEGICKLLNQLPVTDNIIEIDPKKDYYKILDSALLDQQKKSIVYTHPNLIAEWHPTKNKPLTPEKVTSGMDVEIWWRCIKCGNEYPSKMYSRKVGKGCPKCGKISRAKSRSLTAAKKNNFLSQYPQLAKEISMEENPGLDISKLSIATKTPVIWKCPKGHPSYPASVAHRVQGTGCKICGLERTKKAAERKVINLDTGEHFSSLTKAAESVKGDKRLICACCSGRTKTACGFHWQYADNKNRDSHTGMLIHNIETDELFSSIQKAARKYKCDRSSISSALRGKAKTSMGCHWEFVDESQTNQTQVDGEKNDVRVS